METRPIIALIIYQVAFAALQLLAYNSYGRLFLVAAWAVVIVATWIDRRTVVHKIVQSGIQTAWFVSLLAGVEQGQISF